MLTAKTVTVRVSNCERVLSLWDTPLITVISIRIAVWCSNSLLIGLGTFIEECPRSFARVVISENIHLNTLSTWLAITRCIGSRRGGGGWMSRRGGGGLIRANENLSSTGTSSNVNLDSFDDNILGGSSKGGDGIALAFHQVSLQVTLRVTLTIVSGSNDRDLVIGFIVLRVDACSSIEANEKVSCGISFELEHDRMIGGIVRVVGNSNHGHSLTPVRTLVERVQSLLAVVIPSNLPVLGSIVAHLANIVTVERITLWKFMMCLNSSCEN